MTRSFRSLAPPEGFGLWLGVGTVLLLGMVILVIASGCTGFSGRDAAEAVQRVESERANQDAIEEFAVELKRKECQRFPTNPGCEAFTAPRGEPRSRAIVPLTRVLEAEGIDVSGRYGARNLLRDNGPDATPGWRSTSATLPQELTLELRHSLLVDRVAFRQTQASVPESWVRDVELLLSQSASESGYASVGRWTLRQVTAPQEFSFRPVQARFARLRVLSRHGEAEYVALGAFALGTASTDHLPLLYSGT